MPIARTKKSRGKEHEKPLDDVSSAAEANTAENTILIWLGPFGAIAEMRVRSPVIAIILRLM